MAFYKTGGTKWYYSPTIANPDTINALSDAAAVAYFTALSNWILVGETENLGSLGDNRPEVPFTATGNDRVRKLAGAADAGTHQVMCGRDALDVGQIALLTAVATDNHPYKLVLADTPAGGTTPSTQFYAGMQLSKQTQHNDNNSVQRRQFSVTINTGIYESAPV